MDIPLILALLRDFLFLCLLFFETSFTGSAGTSYKFATGVPYGGTVYFVYFLINAIISLCYNILALHRNVTRQADFTSFWYYFFAWLALYQYGRQTAIDYKELGDYHDIWWVFSNIQTMGNDPLAKVAAEPIHWAMTELFIYVLIVQDFVYCFRRLLNP